MTASNLWDGNPAIVFKRLPSPSVRTIVSDILSCSNAQSSRTTDPEERTANWRFPEADAGIDLMKPPSGENSWILALSLTKRRPDPSARKRS